MALLRALRRNDFTISIIITIIVLSSLITYLIIKIDDTVEELLSTEELIWLSNNANNIILASEPYYRPLAFINEKGEHDGLFNDYFKYIENKLDIRFKRVNLSSWSDIMEKGRKKEIDLFGVVTKTPSREEYFNFTQPLVNVPNIIVVNKRISGNVTLKDFRNKQIAVVKEYAILEYIRDEFPYLKVKLVKNEIEGLKMVSVNEVDAFIADLTSASYYIPKLGIVNLRIAGETSFTMKLAIASRKDKPILNSILIKTVASMTLEEKRAIQNKWINFEYQRFLYSSRFWYTIIIAVTTIIAIVIFILLWNSMIQKMVKKKTYELNHLKDHLEELIEARTEELTISNENLIKSMNEVKTLQGFLPICSKCKMIRADNGFWEQIEHYISKHSEAQFSHSLCPKCTKALYGKEDWYKDMK